jgi:RNA polymerase primary sigma factor
VKRDFLSFSRLSAPSLQSPDEQAQGALAALSERERAVLELRFGLKDGRSYSLQAVGEIFGISGERVRGFEARALG